MNNTMVSTIDKSKALPDVKRHLDGMNTSLLMMGVITHINTAGARLFGFTSPDDVIGKKD